MVVGLCPLACAVSDITHLQSTSIKEGGVKSGV